MKVSGNVCEVVFLILYWRVWFPSSHVDIELSLTTSTVTLCNEGELMVRGL